MTRRPVSFRLSADSCRYPLYDRAIPYANGPVLVVDTTIEAPRDIESHRLPAIEAAYQPYFAKAPLTEPPYVDKQQMLAECREWGVEPPKMYSEGWAHANCQASCVRGGQAQWRKLLELRPDTYRFHEGKEQELRDYLGKDVAILRDRSGGRSTPLTLRAFRERQESGQDALFDPFDFGGCGCFVEDVS